MAETQKLLIRQITCNAGTQLRDGVDQTVVDHYAEMAEDGSPFPPVKVFHDGGRYYLADGFHRLEAAKKLGAQQVECDVEEGTLRDARWYACGANAHHGKAMSLKERQLAVMTAVEIKEGSATNLSEIARHCGVHRQTVEKYKRMMEDGWYGAQQTDRAMDTPAGTDYFDGSDTADEADETDGSEAEPQDRPSIAAKTEDEKDTRPRDMVGNVLPNARLIEAFANRAMFEEIARVASMAKQRVRNLAESDLGTFIDAQRAEIDLTNVGRNMRGSAPYAVCPYCQGETCKVCSSQGWVPKHVYNAAPSEMKGE